MCKTIAIIFLLAPSLALAHDCNQFFSVRHGQHFHRATVVVPSVSYFVGAPVRVEALVKKALRQDPEWAEFQQFKAYKAGLKAEQKAEEPQPVKAKLLAATCGRCHKAPEPASGLILDGSVPIAHSKVTQILSWLSGLEKPSGETMQGVVGKIKDQDKPQLMAELLNTREK